tara:strand:- start:1738 stop:2484 length:747 start_codon:yes stop_codon:yes gene_type:complete
LSHREKILNSLKKHGKVIQVIVLDDIPTTDYIYTVVNGDNILQIGSSGPKGRGRLKKVYRGSTVSKHNKAFICGLYPFIVGSDNEYYAIALTNGEDKLKIERAVHNDMGITTNVKAATFIDDITNEGIPKFHLFLWERFKEHNTYRKMDQIEKLMALELYELVTFGTSRITRSSGKFTSSHQADNLEGNILMCLNKLYLSTIWLKMCNNYFRYGKHSISNTNFQTVKEKYQYQEYGAPFLVFGESRKI